MSISMKYCMYLIIKVAGILPKYSHFISAVCFLVGFILFSKLCEKGKYITTLLFDIGYTYIIYTCLKDCDVMIFFCYAVNWNNIPQDMTYRYLVRCEKNATCYYDEVQYLISII